MAFIIEDGTGVAGANSYASVSDADSYFSDRGIAAWSGTNEQKQQWLIQATDYVENRFSHAFAGSRKFTDPDPEQPLSFPRIDIDVRFEGIPKNLKFAISEYALRAKSGLLYAPDTTYDASGLVVSGKKVKVGPIETDLRFSTRDKTSSENTFRPHPPGDLLIKPLLKSKSFSVIR